MSKIIKLIISHLAALLIGTLLCLFVVYRFSVEEATERATERLVDEVKTEYLLEIEAAYRMRSFHLLIYEGEDIRRELELHICENAFQLGSSMLVDNPKSLIVRNSVKKVKTKYIEELKRLNIQCPEFEE